MGTASLVFGLILIGVGIYIAFHLLGAANMESEEDLQAVGLGYLIIVIPMIVIGGLLLRKFDSDRKKEKAQG